jgi:nucleoside-diphosphate-sugar epimerase
LTRRAFILGGTGQIGRAIARDLIDHDWDVMIGHRGAHPLPLDLVVRGAAAVHLDRDEPRALEVHLSQGVDALIDVIAYTERHADQLLAVEENIGHFIVVSSASVYCDERGRTLDEAERNGFPDLPEPIPETQKTVEPGDATYSTRKAALERRLLEKSHRPVTILRPCAIYGLGSLFPREFWFVKRMLDRREAIPLAYRGASRFHTASVANIAALARVALEVPQSRVLNIADPIAPSVLQIGTLIARHLGYDGRFVEVDDQVFPPSIGRTPWSIPRPFVVDCGAALALGYQPATTYGEAISMMCDWLVEVAGAGDWHESFPFLAQNEHQFFDYAAEDAYLASRLG